MEEKGHKIQKKGSDGEPFATEGSNYSEQPNNSAGCPEISVESQSTTHFSGSVLCPPMSPFGILVSRSLLDPQNPICALVTSITRCCRLRERDPNRWPLTRTPFTANLQDPQDSRLSFASHLRPLFRCSGADMCRGRACVRQVYRDTRRGPSKGRPRTSVFDPGANSLRECCTFLDWAMIGRPYNVRYGCETRTPPAPGIDRHQPTRKEVTVIM